MVHYTMADGLPSNTVYDIFRDSKGYLWISTDKGVARFNGIKFENFTTFDGLPSNEIFYTQEDNFGRLWFATYNGNLCYYKDGKFYTASNTTFLRLPFKPSYIRNIFIEKDSSITITFSDQVQFINIKNDQCHTYQADSTNGYNNITYLNKINDSEFEITFGNRKYRLNVSGHTTKSEKIDESLVADYLWCQKQEFFFNKDFVFSIRHKIISKLPNNQLRITDLHRIYYNGRDSFLCTNNGVIINNSLQILKGKNVSSINQDNSNNYWFGTLDNGLYSKYAYDTKLFRNLYNEKIKYSYWGKNGLFFTTYDNNLYQYNNGSATCLFNYLGYKHERYQSGVEPMYLLDSNNKYYSFYNNEYTIIDNIFAPRQLVRSYLSKTKINDIKAIFLVNNNLYIQYRVSLRRLDLNNLREGDDFFSKMKVVSDQNNKFRIYCSAKADDNAIWYSNINNIYKIVNDQPILQPQFKNIAFKSFVFFKNSLVGFTHDNQLMICKNYSGKIDIDSIPFQNCIWDKFYPIDSTHLLISTNNLYRLLTIYPDSSGIKATVTAIENPYIPLQAESVCTDTSTCYFFKDGSITTIDIKSLLSKPASPQLFFTVLKTTRHTISLNSEIEIPFRESKNMRVLFSTLSFNGKDITYQYSFSKNDQDNWTDVKGEEINLVNQGFGTYFIKVRAKTISSEYSEPIIFTLNILKPYWATWWFIILCSGTFIGLVTASIRVRIFSEIRKKEKEHNNEIKFMKSEYKALNALMNPHFIFNTLNNVQGLINRNDKLAANEYLRVFADLIRQNMQNISKELIPLQKEIDLVANYLLLEKLRFKELLNYSINIDEGIDLTDIFVPPLLIQPLVENSIKHGILPLESSEGRILINIQEIADNLVIEIKDNGIGLKKSKNNTAPNHESFGLLNIKKRIEQLSIMQNKEIVFSIGEVWDDSGLFSWTIASIIIPIND